MNFRRMIPTYLSSLLVPSVYEDVAWDKEIVVVGFVLSLFLSE